MMGMGRPVLAVFFGGLLAGLIYLAASSLLDGLSPIAFLQQAASSVLGPASAGGGLASAGIGAAVHFGFCFAAAAVYVFTARALPLLTRQALLFGLLYGAAIYLVVYFVVVPLSLASRPPFAWQGVVLDLLAHMLGFGLPIALSAKYFAGPRRVFGQTLFAAVKSSNAFQKRARMASFSIRISCSESSNSA